MTKSSVPHKVVALHMFAWQVEGTTERPRLAVFRSNNHIYAQVGRLGSWELLSALPSSGSRLAAPFPL
jgi:hypothetical protein